MHHRSAHLDIFFQKLPDSDIYLYHFYEKQVCNDFFMSTKCLSEEGLVCLLKVTLTLLDLRRPYIHRNE